MGRDKETEDFSFIIPLIPLYPIFILAYKCF